MAWGRIYKKGDSYYTDIRHHGKRRRKKIGKNRQVAEKILQKQLGDLTLADHGLLQDEKITVRAFSVEYLNAKKQSLRHFSYVRVKSIIETHLLREFGHLFLYDVTPEKFYSYQNKRLGNDTTNATVNRELSVLKNLLSTAVLWKKLRTNPLANVGQLKEPPGRLRFLTLKEIHTLLNCCPPPPHLLRAIVIMALTTGMRRGEILGLKWEYIKLDNRLIILPLTKNNTVRVVPINETLYQVLEAMPDKTGYVFGNGKPMVNVLRSFKAACKRAGIADFRFHDLRHTYASHLVMKGVHSRVLQELLGHKTPAMTSRYTHLAPAQLHGAVALLDGDIAPK